MHNDIIIFILLIISHIITLATGLIMGYILSGNSQNNVGAPASFLKSTKKPLLNNDISIDEKKVVLDLSTDGMEKKFEDITRPVSIKNDISNSVNKLKNMKGK
jgi:hypothetical protein